MHRLIFAFIILALMAQGAWAEGETALEGQTSTLETEFDIAPESAQNNDVFNMVVIGDSIAWGTGLNKKEKYSYLVADWLKTQLSRPVHVKILAHTGATINRVPDDSTSPTNYPPELSSGRPTLLEQADMILDPNEIPDDTDFILVSGGANDVNLDTLFMLNDKEFWGFGDLVGYSSDVEGIRKRSEDIRPAMYNLLFKLLSKCPNARIVVTGYYTGISNDSKGITEVVATMRPESQIFGGYKKLDGENKGQVVQKSKIFYQISNESLSKAVDDANGAMRAADSRNLPYDRTAFSPIFFPSDRCYGTDQSWLWKIDNTNGQIKTNDHMFTTRVSLLKEIDKYCECEPCSSGSTIGQTDTGTNSKPNSLTLNLPPIGENAKSTQPISSGIDCKKYQRDKLDAVGHPNVDGAKNYSESIIREIRATWPTWLYPTVEAFDVSSRSLTSGESLEITYKVSDNGGSGLKQVELWRSYGLSDWQNISTNTLAGDTGPISGSFTDSPSAPGKYWYGVHVVDNAGNWNDEKNSNTNGQPSSFEPVEVEVKGAATAQESSQAPKEEWNRTYGGADTDEVAVSVQPTFDGGYILAGNTVSSGKESKDYWHIAWLIKTDSRGNEIWNRTFFGGKSYFNDWYYGDGGDISDYSVGIASVHQMRDGGYILAGANVPYIVGYSCAWLMKTDSNGNVIWWKCQNGGVSSVEPTSDGGYIIAGTESYNNNQATLIKTNSTGNEVWSKIFGVGFGHNYGSSVQPTTDGGYILAGSRIYDGVGWLIKTDAEGNELWNRTLSRALGRDDTQLVQLTSDGGYIIACNSMPFYYYGPNALLIKTDSAGNELWNKTFGGNSSNEVNSVLITSDGGYILSGSTYSFGAGSSDAWLIETDSAGNELWNTTFGGKNEDVGKSIQPTSDGGYIIGGSTKSYGTGGQDAWLIKVAPG